MLELASLIILGILAQWVAWKLKIPAILPLILIGLLVGPVSTLFSEDGTKWLQPIYTGEKGIFPGESLFYFVSLAVAVVLFEGGLTLRKKDLSNIGPVIVKLISVGVVITFIGAALAAHFTFDLSWEISFLFASLVIVTGPTVIAPILRHIPLKKDISSILRWEGILIDPIGALVAVLVYEFILIEEGYNYTSKAFLEFGKIVLFGFTFGFAFAYALVYTIKKNVIPHYLLNVVTLATVIGVFVLSDTFAHESGLLAVVIMGIVMGNTRLPNLKELLYFKESMSILLVSILFILLAANIDMEDMYLVFNKKALTLFILVVFVLRPIGVFASSINSGLSLKEKIFISWVGPRGIVAAGIASVFGLRLTTEVIEGAEYITPLVFMVVLGTVLLNATTARMVAKILGVFLKNTQGILVIGASSISRLIGKYLKDNKRHVVLLDNNPENVRKARELGLEAVEESIYSDDLLNNIELTDVGYLMAMTGNPDINRTAIRQFGRQFGEKGSFRLISPEEKMDPENNPPEGLFSPTDEYASLSTVARKYPVIHEIPLKSKEHYLGLVEIAKTQPETIPIFVKNKDDDLQIIPSNSEEIEVEEGLMLVYIGKEIEQDSTAEYDVISKPETGKKRKQRDNSLPNH